MPERRIRSTESRATKGAVEDPPPPFLPPMVPLWFKLGVATVLLLLFAGSYLFDLFNAEYEVPAAMYPVVLLVVGFIYGTEAVKGMARKVLRDD